MNQVDLTVIILTYNESIHIRRCIDSLRKIAKSIVVVDSYSTDDTLNIARSLGAEIYQNPWVNHAVQFQWALDNIDINTKWVMRIDADEYLEGETSKNIQEIANLNEGVTGIIIKRKYFFMGKWMKHGAMHPIYHLKIWRNGAGKIEDKWMDERIVLNYGTSVGIDISIVDDNKNNLTWWTDKHNGYATREMVDSLNLQHNFLAIDTAVYNSGSFQSKFKRFVKNSVYSKIPIFVRPFFYFLYRYFVRFGFLDGTKGLIFHFLHAFWYRILVDAKIYEAKGWIGNETNPEKIKTILSDRTLLKL